MSKYRGEFDLSRISIVIDRTYVEAMRRTASSGAGVAYLRLDDIRWQELVRHMAGVVDEAVSSFFPAIPEGAIVLPEGAYYIGDPALLGEDFSQETLAGMENSAEAGFFRSKAPFQEGVLQDAEGFQYLVTSGELVCARVDDPDSFKCAKGSRILVFDAPFECVPCTEGGYVRMGRVTLRLTTSDALFSDPAIDKG
jgi:hypothetical protein